MAVGGQFSEYLGARLVAVPGHQVFIPAGGTPVAKSGSACTACGMPGGTLMGTASTVLIGG